MKEIQSKSKTGGAMTESDFDRLVYASHETHELNVPEVSDADLGEIMALTNSLAQLREAERKLSESSRSVMNLSAQEMRALQFLVVSLRRGEIVTPSTLASHLGISPASTTKLLNRLERGHLISRVLHPSDRRALKIEVSPQAQALTQRSVGRQQARRFHAAVRLTSAERAVVTKFLDALTRGIDLDREKWITAHQEPTA